MAVPVASAGRTHRTWHALSDVKGHLRKSALKLLGYLVVAYLILRLIPTLNEALHSLKQVSWAWIAGAIVLEFLSEPASSLPGGGSSTRTGCSKPTGAAGAWISA